MTRSNRPPCFFAAICFIVSTIADPSVESDACAGSGCQDKGSNLIQVQRSKERVSEEGGDDETEEPSGDVDVALYGELTLATTVVLVNLSNYTGLIMSKDNTKSPDVSHQFGLDPEADRDLLFAKVEGFYSVLHQILGSEAEALCPKNSFPQIMRCITIAGCALQKVVPKHLSLEAFTLLLELSTRFATIQWPQLTQALDEEHAVQASEAVLVPEEWSCDLSDDGEVGGDASLLQRSTAGTSATLALALENSLAMEKAMKSTHEAFDAHAHNSSMERTLGAFGDAWRTFCGNLGCDHSNYWDVYGVSHQHTLSLLEAGASAQHMRTHVTNRHALELRVQHFLAEHGDAFAKHAYRVDDGIHEQMSSYFAEGKEALKRDTLEWILHQEDDLSHVRRLLDQERFALFVARKGKAADVSEATESHALVQAGEAEEQLSKYGGRRRRRRRIFKVIGDAVVSVVNSVVDFVKDLFECVGTVKSLAAVGYCKKFPLPTSVVGVGVGFGASVGENLGSLLQGTRVANIRIFMGMVVGAVPGSPVTGGIRTGVGIGGRVACTASSCNIGISVGVVAAALWPTGDPQCFFGQYLIGFRCMMGGGISVSILCCNFDLATGAENCR